MPFERVVDLVGDAGGQPADGGQPLGVEELPLQLADARLLVRPRLQPLAPARLLDGERSPSSTASAIAARFRASVAR